MPKSTLQMRLPTSWWIEFDKLFRMHARSTRTAEEMSAADQLVAEAAQGAMQIAAQLESARQIIDQQSGLIDELGQQRNDLATKLDSLQSRCDELKRDLQTQTDVWTAERIQQERYYATSEGRWQHEVDRAHQETQSLRDLFQAQK